MSVRPVVAVVIGTRPEAVKMAPVIRALQRESERLQVVTISTGQHRQMLDQILGPFGIEVDHEMELMEPNQTLAALSARALIGFERVLRAVGPAMLLVQGDTTTAFFGALSAFYAKVPVGHVEAGLRTGNPYAPFPEEMNRRLISVAASLHFAPTETNRAALLREGVAPDRILVTGNTVIDALLDAVALDRAPSVALPELAGRRLVLVTAHRRESFGGPMEAVFGALRDLAIAYPDVVIVYPVHLNPNVQRPAQALLGSIENVHLIPPVDYFTFVHLMARAHLILTDSGGVQEEAPALGVPVLVLRNETERVELVEAGIVELVGTDPVRIGAAARRLLDDPAAHARAARRAVPYGDGQAAAAIVGAVLRYLEASR